MKAGKSSTNPRWRCRLRAYGFRFLFRIASRPIWSSNGRSRPVRRRELLSAMPGVTLQDDPTNSVYPMPVHAAGLDDVFVGRIRQDASHPNGLVMWVVTDNLVKGAALNALQIAEHAVEKGTVHGRKRK